MDTTNKSNDKFLSDIYHSINDAMKQLEIVDSDLKNSEQVIHLEQMDQMLRYIQKRIVEKTIERVLEEESNIVKSKDNNHPELNLKEAVKLIHKIEQKAALMRISVVIAIYNASANPIAIHCMDDAYIASYDIAMNKAYTSSAIKMSTVVLKELSQPGCELYGIQHTNQGRIVVFGGGEPLYYKNKFVGAIGVSGGTEQEDIALAKYGRDILEEVMKC